MLKKKKIKNPPEESDEWPTLSTWIPPVWGFIVIATRKSSPFGTIETRATEPTFSLTTCCHRDLIKIDDPWYKQILI